MGLRRGRFLPRSRLAIGGLAANRLSHVITLAQRVDSGRNVAPLRVAFSPERGVWTRGKGRSRLHSAHCLARDRRRSTLRSLRSKSNFASVANRRPCLKFVCGCTSRRAFLDIPPAVSNESRRHGCRRQDGKPAGDNLLPLTFLQTLLDI